MPSPAPTNTRSSGRSLLHLGWYAADRGRRSYSMERGQWAALGSNRAVVCRPQPMFWDKLWRWCRRPALVEVKNRGKRNIKSMHVFTSL